MDMIIELDYRVWNSVLEVAKSGRYSSFGFEIYSTGGGTVQATNGKTLLVLPFPGIINGIVGKWSFSVPTKSKAAKTDTVTITVDHVNDNKAIVKIGNAEYKVDKQLFPQTDCICDKKGRDTGNKHKFTFHLEQSAMLYKLFQALDIDNGLTKQYPAIQYEYGWDHGFVNFNYGGFAIVMGVL